MLYGTPTDGFVNLISENTFRKKFENTMFPKELTDEVIVDTGYVCLEAPDYDPSLIVDSATDVIHEVTLGEDGKYHRSWTTFTVTPERQVERFNRKLEEIRAESDELLAASDYTELEGYFFMKELWKTYRQALRDITDTDIDPFLIEFPTPPESYKDATDLEGRKIYLLAKNQETYDRALASRVSVDTGLGFSVFGGKIDLEIFKEANAMGVLFVNDSEGTRHTLEAGDYDTIINAVRQHGLYLMQVMWDRDAAIKACTTVEELDLI